ncbi:cell filamentation protein Fic [Bartonella henselae]|uniref:protein adenylyltransferase n=2 Tax=Bartonella TaxID=773 RepID=I3QKD8_BARHN|nr:BID domain-containing T4SS effector [Bartonella henselae]AFK10360.1 BepC [Bartonella henselae]MDM9996705.1 BID domain-containing T4SS effector [Bartonella henselae]OLL47130.1 cell filamentation protein Fic [Bartonella henselae]OLL51669.1 cell filamentation protein Fic [Bartonella henselae]OLL51977.1 cell filamentation protein Fic [Bartonella henselae]
MLEHNYLYKNSKTLKNKYGIKDPQRLYERYAHDTAREAMNLRFDPPPQRFGLAYLKLIHWNLFHRSFEWAGHTRDELFTFEDGSSAHMPAMRPKGHKIPFAVGPQIQKELKQLERKLTARNNLQGLSRREFAENAAEVFMTLDHAHPFRKGNGRAQRLFMEKLGQAAGYKIDFSVITKERLTQASIAAMQHGNAQPMKDLFEDITHPQKSLLLREFIFQMRNSGLEKINEYVVIAAKKGVRYDGIYKGCAAEGFVIELEDGFVVGHKDDLKPEQVKTLQNGDPIVFEKSNVQNLKETLIPKETLAPLTNEELAKRLTNNSGVESYRHEVERLSKRVYNKSEALKEIVEMVNIDPSLGPKFADQIAQHPKSFYKLAGRKIFGIKSPNRRHAEETIPQLCEALKSYADMAQHTMENLIEQHQKEQRRIAHSVEKPGRDLQQLFTLSSEQQREVLSLSPILQKQLHTFARQLHNRLSSEEHRAIQENNPLKLSCMLGVSESKAKEITKAVKQTKEAQCQLRTLKISRSSARALTN